MTAPALTAQEREALTDEERGYVDGLYAFAWWKDGTLYVGTTGTTYASAVDVYLREKGHR